MCLESYECDCLSDQVESWYLRVPSLCQQLGHLGQFFCGGMREFLGIRLRSPRSLGDFQPDGIRLRNTVADLSEAPPRAQ